MRWLLGTFFAASIGLACSVLTSLDQLAPTGDAGGDAFTRADAEPRVDSSSRDAGGVDAAPYVFVDDFNRVAPDAGGLGKDWVSKNVSFELTNDTVSRLVTNSNEYLDNIQTRPSSERVRDVEVSIELTLPTVAPCSPQIHARVDTTTLPLANTLDSYIFYLDNDGTYTHWVIGRQHGGQQTPDTIDKLSASSAIQSGIALRLTLRVQGVNPVSLFASIEQKLNATWQMLGTVTTTDATGLALTNAGVVGFGAGKGTGYELTGEYFYDNFSAMGL